MGSHRAERRGHRPDNEAGTDDAYVGRRAAGRDTTPTPRRAPISGPVSGVDPNTDTGTFHFSDLDVTAEIPLVRSEPGKRRAARSTVAGRFMPSAPVLAGVAVLAVAVGGALTAQTADSNDLANASATPAPSVTGTVDPGRSAEVSRRADRGIAPERADEVTDPGLMAEAEAQAAAREQLLSKLADRAEEQAQSIEDNLWVLPLRPSIITGTFGATSVWSSGHSGLDFNGETGDPIHSIAPGVVTFTGYAGNCGNRTEVLLADNTSLVYCHQTEIYVSTGDVVERDQIIGTVGVTGRVTGSHLHVEVHHDGGPAVDPYPEFVAHGVTP